MTDAKPDFELIGHRRGTIKAIRKQLSEEGVMKLKPPTNGQYQNYYDTQLPGLVLRVNAGGRKAWVVRYYKKAVDKDGKRTSIPTTHKLGRYPTLKVKEAREAARLFMADPRKALLAIWRDKLPFAVASRALVQSMHPCNRKRSQPRQCRISS